MNPPENPPRAAGSDPGQSDLMPLRNALMALAAVPILVLIFQLVTQRNYDYDELSHAHMAWLVSIGERPYRDFAANHFPFLWLLLSPLMRVLPAAPATLTVLRVLALALNGVFLAALLALTSGPNGSRMWKAACLGVIACSPIALQYLIEFRPDPFANALMFGAVLWLARSPARGTWAGIAGGAAIGAAELINTKYLLFPFVLGGVALAQHGRSLVSRRGWVAGMLAGFAAALTGGWLLLHWNGVPLAEAWRMVVAYNGATERTGRARIGLIFGLRQHPVCLAFAATGLAAGVLKYWRQRRFPGPVLTAILIFLALSLVTTARPWKQYVVSWLLLAAGPAVRTLPVFLTRARPKCQVAWAAGLLVASFVVFWKTDLIDPGTSGVDRASQDGLINWTVAHVDPKGFVLSSFDLHPVFWRDTFYKTVVDVTRTGADGIENYMRLHAPADEAVRFTQAGYAADLENRPPSLMVLSAFYTDSQKKALDGYFARHAGEYKELTIPGTSLNAVVRQTDLIKGGK